MAGAIAGGSIDEAQTGEASWAAARDVGLEDRQVVKGGPTSRTAKIAARASRCLGGRGECHAELRIEPEISGIWNQALWGILAR